MRLAIFYACTIVSTVLAMISSVSYKARRALSTRILTSSLLSSTKSCVNTTRSKDLQLVRELLIADKIDAMIIPTDDPHMSEYTANCFGRREFISGFTGSAGTAVITTTSASLFTDGRYHSQAQAELDHNWTLMKVGVSGVPSVVEYISSSLPSGATVGVDESVHGAEAFRTMQAELKVKNISIKHLKINPIDTIWGSRRPSFPGGNVREHPIQYSGKTTEVKLKEVRQKLQKQGASALIVTMLDEVSWLFNLRGSDVVCNPVALSYAIVTEHKAELFIEESKLTEPVRTSLSLAGVVVNPYESLVPRIHAIQQSVKSSEVNKMWIDTKTASQAIFSAIDPERRLEKESPISLLKACKNEVELAAMRDCHLRDGAAVVEFLCWLEDQLYSDSDSSFSTVKISEVELADQLESFRAKCDKFLYPSFETIAGVNENGAIIHYRAKEGECKYLTSGDMLLLDSGGQYIDGTTDVTRTLHMGNPSPYQKEMFTRVLKGHIALDSQVFPPNTPGCLLDTLARQYLWKAGKNYQHGTGHGVGAALNVHEGPQRISPLTSATTPLCAGMIVSNEPGYYEHGNFGIRIENLVEVVKNPDGYLGFKRLTHIPIQVKMIDRYLLGNEGMEWVNAYHRDVWEKVNPLLSSDKAREWLYNNTQPMRM